ncbi:hypothetical protein HXX76_008054 [Chlamydomonas incerta]|uniref:Pherophorin domain-containing protein n=1 Tax=Chlamydomonas incerta TaxID=51695 RepID=A0A835T4H5_CHLIN|nr:hypothetical protein HXX76_008054 [Chlamydomonas incerta]|eukprot:KAG2433684.1 hypothetical protein HXX76_008054 [Chlamydomonas incerta]
MLHYARFNPARIAAGPTAHRMMLTVLLTLVLATHEAAAFWCDAGSTRLLRISPDQELPAIAGQLVAYSGAGTDAAFGTATLALDAGSMALSLTLAPGPGRTWPTDPATVAYATHTSGAAWLAAGACGAPLAGDPNGAPLAGGLAGGGGALTLTLPLDGLGLAPGDVCGGRRAAVYLLAAVRSQSQSIWLQWYDGSRACPNTGSTPFGFAPPPRPPSPPTVPSLFPYRTSCRKQRSPGLSPWRLGPSVAVGAGAAGQLAGALAALDPELLWYCMPLTWQLLGRVVRPYTSPCAGMDLDRVDLLVRGECMAQAPKALRRVALGGSLVSHHFTSHAWPQGGGAKAWSLSVTGLADLVPVPPAEAQTQAQPEQLCLGFSKDAGTDASCAVPERLCYGSGADCTYALFDSEATCCPTTSTAKAAAAASDGSG